MHKNPKTIDSNFPPDIPPAELLGCFSPRQYLALQHLPQASRLAAGQAMAALFRSRWKNEYSKRQLLEIVDANQSNNGLPTWATEALRAFAMDKRLPDLPYEGPADLTINYDQISPTGYSPATNRRIMVRVQELEQQGRYMILLQTRPQGISVTDKLNSLRLTVHDTEAPGQITELRGKIIKAHNDLCTFIFEDELNEISETNNTQ